MRRCSALAFALAALGCAACAALERPLGVVFHHIHVNDPGPDGLIAYYAKLFEPSTTRPGAIGAVRGLEAGGVFMLVNPVREEPSESRGPVWHFGWGTLSLDEGYDQHRMHEIDLEFPMPSFAKDLHIHLESQDPIRAAEWYRDRLGATIATNRANASARPANPIHRRPAALVRFTGVEFAIYPSTEALAPSRGRRIDHLAFKADLAEARRAGLTVLEPSGRLGPFETMMIEGPDRLTIELVGRPVLGPSGAAAKRSQHHCWPPQSSPTRSASGC
jgi:hypothetical protein